MNIVELLESKKEKKYHLLPLSYSFEGLSPILNKQNIIWHYNFHSKGYEKKANEQNDTFSIAGLFLHNIWWSILSNPKKNNKPELETNNLINKNFVSFSNFKNEFTERAAATKGSQWVAFLKSGKIVIIDKHKIIKNIILLLDCWEHSWYPTYGPNKNKYIKNYWKIINWNEVEKRLQTK